MKNFLLLLFFAVSSLGWSQCTELFFSEYVEGSHNNKALEIYNPTDNDIDLSAYRIVRWSNGGTNASEDIQYIQTLSGTITSKSVYIAAVDKRDASATGTDTMMFQEMQDKITAVSHGFFGPTYGNGNEGSKCIYQNGDDALTLEKSTDGGMSYTIVDLFGLIGERPQSSTGSADAGWTDEPDYWNGVGAYWTRDQTLIRKSSITAGVITNPGPPYQSPGAFNPSVEWDSLSINTFDSLGTHTCDCDNWAMSVKSISTLDNHVMIYPNPVSEGSFKISSKLVIDLVELFDITGKKIASINSDKAELIVNTNSLVKGLYMLKVSLSNNATSTETILIK